MGEPAQCSSGPRKRRNVHRSYLARWAAAIEEKGSTKCPLIGCTYNAPTVEEMKVHFVYCDGGELSKIFKCRYCGRLADSAASLTEHVRLSHFNFGAVISTLKKSTENTLTPAPVFVEEPSPSPSVEKAVAKTVVILKPAPKDPLELEEKTLSRNTYVRKRAFHKSHIKSWEIFLEKDGFIRCHLQGCKFIAQSIEEMKGHYGYCTGKNLNTPFDCPFCKGLTTTIELLNQHIQRSHLGSKRFVTTVVDCQLEPSSDGGMLDLSDKNIVNMKVLLVEWRSNGYLRCPYDCNTVLMKLFPLIVHLTSCKNAPPQFNAVCICGFVSQNNLTFLHHTQTCDAIIFHVKNVNTYNFDFQVTEDVLDAWSNLIEDEGFVRCNRCACLTFNVCSTAQHFSACLKESMTVEKFECPFCPGWTKSLDSLIKHVFLSHSTKSEYAVVIRPESFEPLVAIENSHFKIHNEFICQYCETRFGDLPDIQDHMIRNHFCIVQGSNSCSLVEFWKAQAEAHSLCGCPKYPCSFETDTIAEMVKHFEKCRGENVDQESSGNQPFSLENDPSDSPDLELLEDTSSSMEIVSSASQEVEVQLSETISDQEDSQSSKPLSAELTRLQEKAEPCVKANNPSPKTTRKRKKSSSSEPYVLTETGYIREEVTITKAFLDHMNQIVKKNTNKTSQIKPVVTINPQNVPDTSNSPDQIGETLQPFAVNKKVPHAVARKNSPEKTPQVGKPDSSVMQNYVPVNSELASETSQSQLRQLLNLNSNSKKPPDEKLERQKVSSHASADIVSCGVCGLKMTYDIYSEKHKLTHYGLCWIKGEKPVDFSDESYCLRLLRSYQSQFLKHENRADFFRCFICQRIHSRAPLHLAHLKACLSREDSISLGSGGSVSPSTHRTGVTLNRRGAELVQNSCGDDRTEGTLVPRDDENMTECPPVPVTVVSGGETLVSYDDSGDLMVSEEVVLSEIPSETNDDVLYGTAVHSDETDHPAETQEAEYLNEDSQDSEVSHILYCESPDHDDSEAEMQEFSGENDGPFSTSPPLESSENPSNFSSRVVEPDCLTPSRIDASDNLTAVDTAETVVENEQNSETSVSSEVIIANCAEGTVLLESENSEHQVPSQEKESTAFAETYQVKEPAGSCGDRKSVSTMCQTSDNSHPKQVLKRVVNSIGDDTMPGAPLFSCEPQHVDDTEPATGNVESSVKDGAKPDTANCCVEEHAALNPVAAVPQTSIVSQESVNVDNTERMTGRSERLVEDGTRHEVSEHSPRDIIKCGVCRQEMTYSVYKKNHEKKHYKLCWIEGETPINFANDEVCLRILKAYRSSFQNQTETEARKAFRCFKCHENQKGAKEHLKHLRACFFRKENGFKSSRLSFCEKENWSEKNKTFSPCEVKNFDFKDSCRKMNRQTKFSSSDIVKCGLCKEEMTYDIYAKKHQEKHFKLCWIEGETPLNFFDEKRCMGTLMKYQSLFTKSKRKSDPKFFSCFKCKQSHKSAPSHLRHLIVCVVKSEFKNKRHTSATAEPMRSQDSQSRIDFEVKTEDTPCESAHSSVVNEGIKVEDVTESEKDNTHQSNDQEPSNQTEDIEMVDLSSPCSDGKDDESLIPQKTANPSSKETPQGQSRIEKDSNTSNEVARPVEYCPSEETSLIESKMERTDNGNVRISHENIPSSSNSPNDDFSQGRHKKQKLTERNVGGKIERSVTNIHATGEVTYSAEAQIEDESASPMTNLQSERTSESLLETASEKDESQWGKQTCIEDDVSRGNVSTDQISSQKVGRGRPKKKVSPAANAVKMDEPLGESTVNPLRKSHSDDGDSGGNSVLFEETICAVQSGPTAENTEKSEITCPPVKKAGRGRPKKISFPEGSIETENQGSGGNPASFEKVCRPSENEETAAERIEGSDKNLFEETDSQNKKAGRGRPKKKISVENIKKESEVLAGDTIPEVSLYSNQSQERRASSGNVQSEEASRDISEPQKKKDGRGRPKKKISVENIKKESEEVMASPIIPKVNLSPENIEREESVTENSDTQSKKPGRGRPKKIKAIENIGKESEKLVETLITSEVSSCSSNESRGSLEVAQSKESVTDMSDAQVPKAGRGRPKKVTSVESIETGSEGSDGIEVPEFVTCTRQSGEIIVYSYRGEDPLDTSVLQARRAGRGRPKKKKPEESFEEEAKKPLGIVMSSNTSCSSPFETTRMSNAGDGENIYSQKKKIGRGRPRKNPFENSDIADRTPVEYPIVPSENNFQPKKAGRGRPKKESIQNYGFKVEPPSDIADCDKNLLDVTGTGLKRKSSVEKSNLEGERLNEHTLAKDEIKCETLPETAAPAIRKRGRGRPKRESIIEIAELQAGVITSQSEVSKINMSDDNFEGIGQFSDFADSQKKHSGPGRPKKRKKEGVSVADSEEIYAQSSEIAEPLTKKSRCSGPKTKVVKDEPFEDENFAVKQFEAFSDQSSNKRPSARSDKISFGEDLDEEAENREGSDEEFDASAFAETSLADEETDFQENKPGRGKTEKKKDFKRKSKEPEKKLFFGRSTNEEEENSKYAPSDNIKCGACEEEMTYEMYQSEHREKHFKLCWIEGETPIDLFDDVAVNKILSKYQSLFIRLKRNNHITRVFRCFKCNDIQKSSIGHISHLRSCVVKDEDKMKALAACEICGHFLKRSSMISHRKMCLAYEEQRKSQEFGEPIVFERSRRSAAVKAESTIKKLRDSLLDTDGVARADSDEDVKDHDFKVADADEEEEEDRKDSGRGKRQPPQPQKRVIPFFRKRQSRISGSLIKSWEAALSKGAEGCCIVPGCSFRSVDFEILKSHFQNCPLSIRNEFSCQDCPFRTEHIGEIETHVQTVHGHIVSRPSVSALERKTNLIFSLYPPPEDSRFVDSYINKLDFTYKWTLNFFKEKLSESHAFEFLKSNVELSPVEEEKLSNYLPNCRESVTIYSADNECSQLQLFESKNEESLLKIFVGGPIWALAWAPASVKQTRQFLALSTHHDMDAVYTRKDNATHSGLIQIWEFPCLNNLSPKADDPKLVFGIAHDYGTVWSMEWCPSAKMPDDRIGLLAVGFSCGLAAVYSVPCPENLPEAPLRYPVYKLKPSLVLDLQMSESAQCTRIAWQRVKPHNMLVAGYANGFVGVWDVNTTSPLLKQGNVLLPYQVFQPHLCPISGLQFGAIGENRYITTAALDRCGVFCWDLKDTSSPIFHTARTKARNNPLMTDLVWPNHWLSLVSSADDAFNLGSAAQLNALREFNFSVETLMPQTAVNWSLSYSEWTGSIVISAGDGSVFMIAPGQLLRVIEQKGRNIKRRIMTTKVIEKSTGTVIDRSKKKKKSFDFRPLKYPEAAKDYGVQFAPVMESFKITTNNNVRPLPSNEVNFYPLQSVNKVAWNPNCQSFLWLALGYQNGILCLSHKDIVRSRTLEDYYSVL